MNEENENERKKNEEDCLGAALSRNMMALTSGFARRRKNKNQKCN